MRVRECDLTGCSSSLAMTFCTIVHCTSASTWPPMRLMTTKDMAQDSGAITSAKSHPYTWPQHSTPATTKTIPGRCSSSANPKPRMYRPMPKYPALSIALCTWCAQRGGGGGRGKETEARRR